MISLATLFAAPTQNLIIALHELRDGTPFFDAFLFVKLSQNLIFLNEGKKYFSSPCFAFAHFLFFIFCKEVMYYYRE